MGPKVIDLTGMKFTKWTVIKPSKKQIKGVCTSWLCKCSCGIIRNVSGDNLRLGRSKSCGCSIKESLSTHGMSKHPLFSTWNSMVQRCHNSKNSRYKFYGKMGRKVDILWRYDFKRFLRDIEHEIGQKPSNNHTLDRINNKGNYAPGNVKWSTQKEQCNNTRRNRYVFYKNEKLTVAQCARRLDINYHVLYNKVKKGIINF